MRLLAFLVVALFLILGVIGLLVPQRLLALAQLTTTPSGIYVVAGMRVAVGLILLGVASRSRWPMVLRVLGVLVVISGIGTLMLGSERARAIVAWATNQGLIVVRALGVFALAMGGLLAYAVSNKRPA